MNLPEITTKHLQAIKSYADEGTSGDDLIDDFNFEKLSESCTQITLIAIIEELQKLKPKIFDTDSLFEIGIAINELKSQLK